MRNTVLIHALHERIEKKVKKVLAEIARLNKKKYRNSVHPTFSKGKFRGRRFWSLWHNSKKARMWCGGD